MNDQSNSWSIQMINSFSSNWFTLLLLCTSAPLVLYCDRFDRGSRQVKREPVDLLMEDYDVSLFQRVGIHNYYTKDHIIRPKKKLLYWSNPPDPNFTPYPRHFYLFIYFFLRRKNKNKSIIMDIKVGKPQNMQLYVRRKVKMFRSPILLCGYGLCVQV